MAAGPYKPKDMSLSLTLALRYLRARKAEGFVSVIAGFSFLGIMLGVATLIIVMSVMNGFQTELLQRLLGLNGHVTVVAPARGLMDYGPLRDDLLKIPGVTQAAPLIEQQGLLSVKGNSVGVMVRGYDFRFIQETKLLTDKLTGDVNNFKGDGVWIGSELARRLGLSLGDPMTLLSPQGRTTPFGTVPKSLTVTVSGIFDVGMYEYNAGFVLMPLETAQMFYELPYAVSEIALQTENPEDSYLIKEKVEPLLTETGARVQDWRDANQSYFNALAVERNVMFLILTLIIIVAAFNVISGMIMMVKDKTKDIAILRTMGASRALILKTFVLVGGAIGVLGTIGGTILGTVFALNIETIRQAIQKLSGTELFSPEVYFLSQLPAELQWHEVAIITGMSLILSFLATLYPAWRAASVDPVEALRYG